MEKDEIVTSPNVKIQIFVDKIIKNRWLFIKNAINKQD